MFGGFIGTGVVRPETNTILYNTLLYKALQYSSIQPYTIQYFPEPGEPGVYSALISQLAELVYEQDISGFLELHSNLWKQTVPLFPLSFSLSLCLQGGEDEVERAKMREVSKRLYAQLQEAEKKHQEERERLQAEGVDLRQRLGEQEEKLKGVEESSERKDQRIEELQRLLGGMAQESQALRDTLRNREEELRELRKIREEGRNEEQRSEQLEKELAILKEKIHHLDDMLKSQQRKVRHMIEQLQNSRMVIQERDRVIRDLEEKVAFLEAENREMHDQMDYFLAGERSNSHLSSDRHAQIVYSKPLKPTNMSNKPLPFIKIIETKS